MAPAASAVATTSASRTEPPGWTTAVTPAARHTSRASVNGKKASEAHAAPASAKSPAWVARLVDGSPGGVHPRRLTRAHADEPAVADEDDRVRDDAPDQAPGQVKVAALCVRRGPLGDDGPGRRVVRGRVRRRHEDGPARRPDRAEGIHGATGSVNAQVRVHDKPQVRLGGEDGQRVGLEGGRDDDLEEDRGQGSGGRPIHGAGERHHTAERRDGIAGQRRLPRREQRRPFGRTARVGVLDDDAARTAQRTRQRRRR